MSMNWMPGAGRGWVPGSRGSALSIASSVGYAKAYYTSRYSGIS